MNINLPSLSNNEKSSHICVKYGSEDVYTAGKSANWDLTPNWAQFISVAGQRLYTIQRRRPISARLMWIPLWTQLPPVKKYRLFTITYLSKKNNIVSSVYKNNCSTAFLKQIPIYPLCFSCDWLQVKHVFFCCDWLDNYSKLSSFTNLSSNQKHHFF